MKFNPKFNKTINQGCVREIDENRVENQGGQLC